MSPGCTRTLRPDTTAHCLEPDNHQRLGPKYRVALISQAGATQFELNLELFTSDEALRMERTLQELVASTDLPDVDVAVGCAGSTLCTSNATTDAADTGGRRFLVASITKPIVAMAMVKLAAEGQISFSERLRDVLPEFRSSHYRKVSIRHLLTHSSGFPDMLPNNAELRAAHAGLPEFIAQANSVDLDFLPGNASRYSSVGFLLIGAIIEKLTGQSTSEFLRSEFFDPLAMNDSWLGMSDSRDTDALPSVMPCTLPPWQENATDWGWNSSYWRQLGAPWGGLISSAGDLGRYAQMILHDGAAPDGRQVLPAAAVVSALSDQTSDIPVAVEHGHQRRSRGFGWRKQWASHAASFGDFLSTDCVGHWGATGTLMWIDPQRSAYSVILTTTPYENSRVAIQRLSNKAATEGPLD